LSTLTKVLIVLLSLFSFFLCGTVVIYVGNANNYRRLYDLERDSKDIALAEQRLALNQYSERTTELKDQKEKFTASIQTLQDEVSKLTTDLNSAQRENLRHQTRSDGYVATIEGFQQTIANLTESLKAARNQLDEVRAADIQEQKEFNELTARLLETLVQVESLQADKRRLLEEKTALEEQIRVASGGRAEPAAQSRIVTLKPSQAVPAAHIPSSDVKGLVAEVSESLVAISIGSADGVERGMILHITRGDEFVCNLEITDVDVNKAAGVLQLKLKQPRIGDTVSTRL